MKVSIVGLGWYGKPLAQKLSEKHNVSGTKSTREAVEQWDVNSVSAHYLDLNSHPEHETLKAIFDVDTIVINIPPSASKSENSPSYLDQMKYLLKGAHKFGVGHIIFVSSTGVFGEHQHVVSEDIKPEPSRGNGEILLQAENYLADTFAGRLSIIRPGGLVGGDRHPAKYLAGRTHVSGKIHPINLVRREDLIALTEYIIENKTTRKCFHAVASKHPSKKEFYTKSAEEMGLKIPEFDETDMSKGKLILGEKTQAETVEFVFNDPFKMTL